MSEIKKSQIAEKDVLGNLIPTQQQLQLLKSMNEELREAAKLAKNDLGGTMGGVDDIKKRQKAQESMNKIANQKAILDKEELKLQKQLAAEKERVRLASTKEAKELQQLRAEKSKINKATRDEIKQAERAKNAYSKLSDETRDLKNESKRLGAEMLALESANKKNTKEYKDLSRQYTDVTSKAQRYDAQLKKLDKSVGDNFRNVGNYANATRKLTSALSSLGIAVGVGAIFRNVGGIIANYNQAVTDLGAISGKTAEELEPLNEQARELGATTQFSASEVTGLQIELAKLGFTTQEIMDSTGGIANFAAATGVEIPRAAALAGSALRAFGLDATEIDRVVSTLGVATTKTALDFSKLENGLSTVAPVAASFGFSIEDTTALLGQLSNAGFDASSSATATRNILLNLADSGGALAQELGRPVKNAADLAAGLQELQARGVDLASALELTDKRSVAAFSTFIEGSGSLVSLRDSITDVNDELTDMAEKRLDSVQGAIKLLASAWEGFVLNLNEAIGASDAFQTTIRFVADNLGTIIGVLGRLIGYWAAYRIQILAVNSAKSGFLRSVYDTIRSLPRMIRGLKGASFSFKGLGRAMKGVPFIAIIAAVTELTMWLWNSEEATNAVTDAEREATAAYKEGTKARAERASIGKDLDAQFKIRNQLSQAELKLLADKLERETQIAQANALKIKTSKKLIKDNKAEDKALKAKIKTLRDERIAKINSASPEYLNALQDEITKLESQIVERQELQKLRKDGIRLTDGETGLLEKRSKQLTEVNSLIVEETTKTNKNTESKKKNTKSLKDLNKEKKKQIDLQEELRRAGEDIEDADLSNAVDATDVQAEVLQEYQKELTKTLTEINDFERLRLITTEEAAQMRLESELEAEIKRRDFLKSIGVEIYENEKTISDLRLQLANLELDNQKEIDDKLKQLADQTQEQITQGLKDNIDRRIELRQDEIDASQQQQELLQGLAKNGNIEAQQSIKEEIEAQKELLKEQQLLERQKQTLELVSSGLSTFSAQVDNGASPAEALATTIATSQALVQFLSNLSFFEKGTDNAPQGLAVVDEKGAEIITDKFDNIKEIGNDSGARFVNLQRGDKVKTAEETQNLLSQMGAVSDFTKSKDVAGTSYDLMAIKKLENIEKAIKNQPQSVIGYDSALHEIVNETRKGNIKRINRYRTK
jgi:TP901 family phage tail tape measure protein